ncbi:hypothetical protein [Legionella cherrii]|uniref:Uncharacterized protein n=1 Tax=Legionella cherrii TaxID=28084 RepID=A0A0W0SAV9_9GAMM|nr:hypothetical protein [Legionella cherrii]KTC80466.1 hypothetical protein Lche_2486 [Legionella cherrii]VEB39212.1 Uncharacterised protein [Legionella cherrii]
MPYLKYSDSSKFIIEALTLEPNRIGMKKQGTDQSRPLDVISNEELTAPDKTAIDLFDLEEMMEFLLFSEDHGQNALTIRPKPSLLFYQEKDVQDIVRLLKLLFEQFKIALETKGVPVDNFTVTLNKNELVVCNNFIKAMISNNLFPKTNILNQQLENQPPRLTPFTTKPSPSVRNDKKEKEVEENGVEYVSDEVSGFNPSPFSLTKFFGWDS